jgi:hypothetical protein
MWRQGRGGEPVEGNPWHGGRAMEMGHAALALKVAEHNSSGVDAMARQGFSWIEHPGKAAAPGRGGKGREEAESTCTHRMGRKRQVSE